MWTPPIHYDLEFSGRAAYMETHPKSGGYIGMLAWLFISWIHLCEGHVKALDSHET